MVSMINIKGKCLQSLLKHTFISFLSPFFRCLFVKKKHELFLPYESGDLKTGGLEIPDPCYTESNPSIGVSNHS